MRNRGYTTPALNNPKTTGTGVLVGLLVVAVVQFFLNALFVMLFLGWLHEDVASIPALGYGSSLILVALVTTLGSAWNGTVVSRLNLSSK